MKLYIDNQLCLTDSATRTPTLRFDASDLRSFDALRKGRRHRLSIPICRQNRQILGYDDRIHDANSFNDTEHKARIEFDGVALIEGTVLLVGVECTPEGDRYTIEIIAGAHEWARTASLRQIDQVGIDFSATFNTPTITDSWNDDRLVRLLPVLRDRYSDTSSEVELMPVQQIPSLTDFHPFVSVPKLVEAIFTDAGYRVESKLVDSHPFNRLVMSGRFAERNTARLDAQMGFRAGRLEATSATADIDGMVYANPFTSLNTVGNLVNTVAPSQTAPDLHAADDSFRIENGGAIFAPHEKVNASIVCHLHYATDYQIASRHTLKGFDTIWLDPENCYKFALANRFVDHRPTFRSGMEYRCVVFNHRMGTKYRLMYLARQGMASTQQLAVEFSANNALFTISSLVTASEPKLMYLPMGATVYAPYPGDWALYAGYVEMTGQTEVEVTVATAPREISASEPYEFRKIIFDGAASGQSMTLYASTRAYPSFQPNPALGSTFTLSDILHHDMRQIDLLEALAQMFNLRFYTDPVERKVYIESAADMVDRECVIDWSDRIVPSQPIVIESAATGSDEAIRHRYITGDGAVARYNQQHDDRFGEWVGQVHSKLADEGTRDACNPLFVPTINATEIFALAPSVSLPQVGDRDADEDGQLNFPTKILLYNGIKELPEEERWGLTAATYPHAAFHSDEGTLCFEDRDGMEGLHRYFDAHYEELNSARRVTLSLQLSATDLLPIIATDPAGGDLRSTFRLTIGGEEGLYRLEAIEEWSEKEQVARCRFVQLV